MIVTRWGWCGAAAALVAAAALAQEAGDSQQQEGAVQEPSRVDPRAEEALKKMGRYLAEQKTLRFEAVYTQDELLGDGLRSQVTRRVSIELRRPDRLAAESTGDDRNKGYWYDGAQLTFLDREANVFSRVKTPATLDAMFDFLSEQYDMSMPLVDFLLSDPYTALAEGAGCGRYLGQHKVGEDQCHHLAFAQQDIDWQVWIATGDKPLPRKFMVAYGALEGVPQFSAIFRKWETGIELADERFEFKPPPEAMEVELLKPAREDAAAETQPE